MRKYSSLLIALVLTVVSESCSKTSSATVDLRGSLVNADFDFYFIDCGTKEKLWVDSHALALVPWPVDGGKPQFPLYLDIKARVESNGPYGYMVKTSRAIVEIGEVRTMDTNIPAQCSQ